MSTEFNSMEDLAFSRSFRNWVLNREGAEKGFWENWIARNPEKADMVKYAKAVIYALHGKKIVLSEDEIDEEVRKSVARLREAPRYIPLDGLEGRARRWMGLRGSQRIWAAAALGAAVGLAAWFFYRVHSQRDPLFAFLNSHRKELMHEQATDDSDDDAFNLPDESLVKLGKSGKLYYPRDWAHGTSRREVFLEGDAFFDVRKNPAVPFLVYTDALIVKALGTSFIVHSSPSDNRPVVTVVTGKVSVYRQEDFFASAAVGREPAGILLMPNQEGIFDRRTGRWQRTLIGVPEQMSEKPDTSLVFEDTPVREVFGRLRELYGIPIQYDEQEVARCCVSVRLGNESYYDHLRKICKAIGGSYEVIDGNVVVTASACQGKSGGGPDK